MTKVQMRRGTTSQWSSANPVLASGEMGYDSDLKDSKMGDGSSTWKQLPFLKSGIVYGPPPSGGDDTSALAAFFNANVGRRKALHSGAIYKVDTGDLPNPGHLEGNGAVFDCQALADGTTLGQRYCFKAQGSMGTGVAITSGALLEADVSFTVTSSTGITAGTWILINNAEQPVPGMTRTDRLKGEMAMVESVAGNVITLDSGINFDYGTTGLQIQKLTVLDDVDISDLQIVMGGIASAHTGVMVRYATNVRLDNLRINGAEEIAISLEVVSGFNVTRCRNSDSTSSTTLGLSGYGVAVMDASQHGKIEACHFRNNRHHVAGGGEWPPIHINVMNNHGRDSSSASWDCHESCFDWTFAGNTAVKGTHGIYVRGQRITVRDNHFRNMSAETMAARCWDGVTEQRGIRFLNNRCRNSGWGLSMGSVANESTHRLKDIEVRGNRFENVGTNPIRIDGFDGAIVSDNIIQGGVGSGIKITGASSGNRSTDLQMANNTVRNNTAIGIEVNYVDGLKFSGGAISQQGLTGMQIDNCVAISITGMHIHKGTGTSSDCIRILNSDGIVASGNYFASLRWAMYITTSNNMVITGNDARDCAQGPRFNIDASGTNKIVANNLET